MRSGDYERRLRDATAEIADLRTRLADVEGQRDNAVANARRIHDAWEASEARLASTESRVAAMREALEAIAKNEQGNRGHTWQIACTALASPGAPPTPMGDDYECATCGGRAFRKAFVRGVCNSDRDRTLIWDCRCPAIASSLAIDGFDCSEIPPRRPRKRRSRP